MKKSSKHQKRPIPRRFLIPWFIWRAFGVRIVTLIDAELTDGDWFILVKRSGVEIVVNKNKELNDQQTYTIYIKTRPAQYDSCSLTLTLIRSDIMKFKNALTGLLLFSGAAQGGHNPSPVVIDKTNYKQHFCDDSLFSPVTAPAQAELFNGQFVMNGSFYYKKWKDRVSQLHGLVCANRQEYIEAVGYQNSHCSPEIGSCANTSAMNSSASIPTQRECVDMIGVSYAKNCEELRVYKKDHPGVWNDAIKTVEPCVTVACSGFGRRRF